MKHFTINELCRSACAIAARFENKPTEFVKDNLIWFIENVLDPIRENYGLEIVVNSGYRCKKLNTLVHGNVNSYHMLGLAADIRTSVIDSVDDINVFQRLLSSVMLYKNSCKFGSYIDFVVYDSFIHIEFDSRRYAAENVNHDFLTLTYK